MLPIERMPMNFFIPNSAFRTRICRTVGLQLVCFSSFPTDKHIDMDANQNDDGKIWGKSQAKSVHNYICQVDISWYIQIFPNLN